MIRLRFGPTKAVLEWPTGIRDDELIAIPRTPELVSMLSEYNPVSNTTSAELVEYLALDLPKLPSLFWWRWFVEQKVEQHDLDHYSDPSLLKPLLPGIPKPTRAKAWTFTPPKLLASWPQE